MNAKEK